MGKVTHLALDILVPDEAKPAKEDLEGLTRTLAEASGMQVVAGPFAHGGDWGAMAVLVLAESHASAHYHPEERTIHLDLFSCRPFSALAVLARLEALLGANWRVTALEREIPRPEA